MSNQPNKIPINDKNNQNPTISPLQNQIDSQVSSKTIGSIYSPFQEIRQRGYLGNKMNRVPIFNQQTPSQENPELNSSIENIVPSSNDVYWGTNISVFEIQTKIKAFLINFQLINQTDNQIIPNYYVNLLKEIKETEIYILNLDASHLNSYDRTLYLKLINFPSEMIPIMDTVANTVYGTLVENINIIPQSEININNQSIQENKNLNYIHVAIYNLTQQSRIRDLGPDDIDKLISITGLTIRTSEIIPEMREAYFKCSLCSKPEVSVLNRSKISEPSECLNCKAKFSFEIIHNRSLFTDKQHVKLQETPEHMPDGETPLTLHLCCYDELVDFLKPGDRCEIVGIFRAQGLRINPRIRVTKSIYRTYVDVVSFSKHSKKRFNVNNEKMENDTSKVITAGEINEENYKQIKDEINKLKKNPDIYNILCDSLAPSIWENEDVKKGLLLQLFGGVSKDFTKSGRGRFRGDINVLLVGDPSTAKSQLLQYVNNLAPRGIYTSGKGSSVVGLTAYVTKDPETKDIILESGALVLSDKGICCIDEFDKMDDNTRTILHEAMEQQTISIAKAGIICQLNARTAILASANPINSKYDPKLSVVKNINIPPTLLSRFDLIYLMLDKHNEAYDRRLANHIVSLYGRFTEEEKTNKNQIISKELLTSYISEARKHNPKIHDVIVQEIIRMRNISGSKNTISATPRQLESLIRLSEARARLRFSEYVELEDVNEAIRLIKVATQQAATDPVTGKIDMDMITTGTTTSSRQKIHMMTEDIKKILVIFFYFFFIFKRDNSEVARRGVKLSSISEELKKKMDNVGTNIVSGSAPFSEYELRDAIRLLEEDNVLVVLGNKFTPTIRLIAKQYQ